MRVGSRSDPRQSEGGELVEPEPEHGMRMGSTASSDLPAPQRSSTLDRTPPRSSQERRSNPTPDTRLIDEEMDRLRRLLAGLLRLDPGKRMGMIEAGKVFEDREGGG